MYYFYHKRRKPGQHLRVSYQQIYTWVKKHEEYGVNIVNETHEKITIPCNEMAIFPKILFYFFCLLDGVYITLLYHFTVTNLSFIFMILFF